jgi:Proteasome/cyclosome repeat
VSLAYLDCGSLMVYEMNRILLLLSCLSKSIAILLSFGQPRLSGKAILFLILRVPHTIVVFRLGIAYAGSCREEVLELLLPLVSDTTLTIELSALAALSLGLVFVGSCHGDITSSILQALMEHEDASLNDPYAKFMGLGLALLFLGKQDAVDAPLETIKIVTHPISKQVQVMLEMSAYAGMSFQGVGNCEFL